jgi:hypothetical protein
MPNSASLDQLDLERDGARLVRTALDATTRTLVERALAGLPSDQAGVRLFGLEGLRPFLQATGAVGALAAPSMGMGMRPVRAILFDKSPKANWPLAWHQDRVVAVRERVEVVNRRPRLTPDRHPTLALARIW